MSAESIRRWRERNPEADRAAKDRRNAVMRAKRAGIAAMLPPKPPPLTEQEKIERAREYRRKYREKNREKCRNQTREYKERVGNEFMRGQWREQKRRRIERERAAMSPDQVAAAEAIAKAREARRQQQEARRIAAAEKVAQRAKIMAERQAIRAKAIAEREAARKAAKLSSVAAKENLAETMRRRGRPPKIEHGDKSQYMKMTITISPEAYDLLITEVARRKRARAPEPTISAIIREMTMKYLADIRAKAEMRRKDQIPRVEKAPPRPAPKHVKRPGALWMRTMGSWI